MAPATILGGYISDKLGSKALVINMCLPLSAIATMAIPMSNSTFTLVLFLALYGATGKLVIDPGLINYVSESSPPESRSTMLALFNFAGALAMAVAPAVTGYLAEAIGSFDVSFFMAGAFNFLALVSFIVAAKLFERNKR
jgi:MFS family permease